MWDRNIHNQILIHAANGVVVVVCDGGVDDDDDDDNGSGAGAGGFILSEILLTWNSEYFWLMFGKWVFNHTIIQGNESTLNWFLLLKTI